MAKKLRVLHIINDLAGGGAEKLLVDLLNNRSENIDYHLYLIEEKNYFHSRLDPAIKIFSGKEKESVFAKLSCLSQYIRENEIDIVHSHLSKGLYYGFILKKLNRDLKLVYTEHSTHNRRRKYRLFKIIEKRIYSTYDRVICISYAVRESLINWIGKKNRGKVIVAYNAIDLSILDQAKKIDRHEISKTINKEDRIIIMVSRYSQAKDQKTLIKSLKYLDKNIKLLLIGQGDKKEELDLAEELGLENRIIFEEYKTNIYDYILTADLLVQSSNWEGFGLSVIEAIYLKKPVLVSDVAGLDEIVKDRSYRFEVGNSKELAFKIEKILTGGRQKNLLYEKVDFKTLSIENYARLVEDIYIGL